jgi:ribonuclease VapC
MIAILRSEADSALMMQTIVRSDSCIMSAVSVLETAMVLAGREAASTAWAPLDAFLQRAGIQVVAFDDEQARVARNAFIRYGKGRHKASLNFGDCAAYALASTTCRKLLFKGNDFGHTDIEAALAEGQEQ